MTDYRTETVMSLARAIQAAKAWDRLPILADAMEEAGYTDAGNLNELRAAVVFGRAPLLSCIGRIMMDLFTTTTTTTTTDLRNPNRRTRLVSTDAAAADAAAKAMCLGAAFVCRNGGGVANAYKYPAVTDGVLAAAVYDPAANRVVIRLFAGELPANKVTPRGVCAMHGFPDLLDGRVSATRQAAAAAALFATVTGAA